MNGTYAVTCLWLFLAWNRCCVVMRADDSRCPSYEGCRDARLISGPCDGRNLRLARQQGRDDNSTDDNDGVHRNDPLHHIALHVEPSPSAILLPTEGPAWCPHCGSRRRVCQIGDHYVNSIVRWHGGSCPHWGSIQGVVQGGIPRSRDGVARCKAMRRLSGYRLSSHSRGTTV